MGFNNGSSIVDDFNNGHPLSAYFWVTTVLFIIWIMLIVYCFRRNLRRTVSQNSLIEQIHRTRNSIRNNSLAVSRAVKVINLLGNYFLTHIFCIF